MELSQVKPNLNTVVSYNNTEYILIGCTIRRDKKTNEIFYQAELADINARDKKTNEIFYQAELADINARSVLIARLGDIKATRRDEFE